MLNYDNQKINTNFKSVDAPFHNEITNSFISFCEKMGSVFEIKDFLLVLKSQIPKHFKLGELLLFYESPFFGLRRAYIRNKRFYEESAKKPWSDVNTISSSQAQHSLYLASELGRPFSKSLIIPFQGNSKADKTKPALLFIEMSDWEKKAAVLTHFFQERRDVLNLIFNRTLFNTKFNRISYLWSQLFTYWGEPLAILQNFQPVRTNHSFKHVFSESDQLLKKKKLKGLLNIGGKNYQIHYYPISQLNKTKPIGILYCQDQTKDIHLKEQLFQSEKMASLCELGKDIAHQLNNPLTGLRSMVQILSQNEDMKMFEEELIEIEKATERSQRIIQNLLSFSKIQGKKNSCNLNQAVKNCLPLLKSRTKNVSIQLELCKDNMEVQGDLSILQQVAYNLILNSCQALQNEQIKPKACIQVSTKKISKTKACLKVKDNGPGIEKHNLEKIFQALWTSKNKKQGTGLGLSISRQFVRKFGGDIFVTSKEKEWTCFTVLLPTAFPTKT